MQKSYFLYQKLYFYEKSEVLAYTKQKEKHNIQNVSIPFSVNPSFEYCVFFCFLLCLSCADFCRFSDLLDQFICKCAFFHSPHPVTAECRWHINSCLITKSQIILYRNDARICHTSHRQTYESQCTSSSGVYGLFRYSFVISLSSSESV